MSIITVVLMVNYRDWNTRNRLFFYELALSDRMASLSEFMAQLLTKKACNGYLWSYALFYFIQLECCF